MSEPAVRPRGPTGDAAAGPLVLDLTDPACCDPALAGAKAANLARAAVAGLPILPGFALTTVSFDADDPAWSQRDWPAELLDALRPRWTDVSASGAAPLVVRSSSTVEDIGESSMAGQFRSVLDVVGWEGFLDAVRSVLASARSAVPGGEVLPMAVLVQRQLDAEVGGVAFGIDPVTGDPHHYLIEAVRGGPDQLVSGTVTAARYVVGHQGRLVEADDEDPPVLDRRRLRRVARLVHRASAAFDRTQDIEWAIGPGDELWLLQSRPVTATGELAGAAGPLLGPGPVGETFPDPLRPLEDDLWIEPLRAGIERAIALTGVVSTRRLAASPVVTLVGGRVAADLSLFGYAQEKRSGWQLLDPRPGARRLVAAWRVGQVRMVLPGDIAALIGRVDAALADVPVLAELDESALFGVLDQVRGHLAAVHGHEVLAGTLLRADDRRPSAAAVALAQLAAGRERGWTDAEIVVRSPVVLALVPPCIGRRVELPAVPPGGVTGLEPWRRAEGIGVDDLGPRDALRLRARWLHELSARAATELSSRLVGRGALERSGLMPYLRLEELGSVVAGQPVPPGLETRATASPGPPLPAAFRQTEHGLVAPVRRRGDHRPGGRGAGGGRGSGPVVHGGGRIPRAGEVLVVRTLSPSLAAHLPVVTAIVSETGSVLSHLAILAREYHVPTVVAVHDALHRYPEGTPLLVDGDTGEVTVLDLPEAAGGQTEPVADGPVEDASVENGSWEDAP